MLHLALKALFSSIAVLALASQDQAQTVTATYHLHNEASSTPGNYQLKTAGPDAASLAVQSADLKNAATGEYFIRTFDTQAGVPNAAGTIPSGSTVSFTLWMKRTANFGTMFPVAKLHLNSLSGASVCTATGSSELTTTLPQHPYTLTCTTSSSISMLGTDRFYLWTGVNVTAAPVTTA